MANLLLICFSICLTSSTSCSGVKSSAPKILSKYCQRKRSDTKNEIKLSVINGKFSTDC